MADGGLPVVVLMGLRASGKSSVARRLAQTLSVASVDLDDVVARDLGCTNAAESIRIHGWDAFRAGEAEALGRTLGAGSGGLVLALGGGTPTAPGADALLHDARQTGTAMVVYLRAEPEVLAARLLADQRNDRPSLTGDDPAAEMRRVFDERDPLYRSLASTVIEVGDQTVDAIVDRIRTLVQP